MRIFLEKSRTKTLFSRLQPIVVEPLELGYIKSCLEYKGHEVYIIDELFKAKAPVGAEPDLIILNGYNVAENAMLTRAEEYKRLFPKALVSASGVHVQLNRDIFRVDQFDIVVHTQSIGSFIELLDQLDTWDGSIPIDGFDLKNKATGNWVEGKELLLEKTEDMIPRRDIFKAYRGITRYLDRRDVALFKSGIGCPYGCSFCYCRGLNGGRYIRSDYNSLFDQMMGLGARNSWIVDDILLKDDADALDFIRAAEAHCFKGEILGYLRADFIKKYPELMPRLGSAGLKEVIIGFEAPFEAQLDDYDKGMSSKIYKEVCETLRSSEIDLTALFIVDPNYTHNDFKKLRAYIRELNIEVFTLSIFTPLKGTKDYEKLKTSIIDNRPERSDFLHLILPSRLAKPIFYLEFYLSHLRLLKSGRVWKYILKRK